MLANIQIKTLECQKAWEILDAKRNLEESNCIVQLDTAVGAAWNIERALFIMALPYISIDNSVSSLSYKTGRISCSLWISKINVSVRDDRLRESVRAGDDDGRHVGSRASREDT